MPRARRAFLRSGRLVGTAALAVAAASCASPALRDARHAASAGDRPALRQALLRADAHGHLATGDAADLARAVVRHEVDAAAPAGPAGDSPDAGRARVRELRGCVTELEGLLRDRARAGDGPGGEAAWLLAEAGSLRGGAARAYEGAADDRLRAVAMRSMTREADRDARVHGLVDGSALVRRAALEALVERGDAADLPLVLDVARRDPEPALRGAAVRALPSLVDAKTDLAIPLRDLWATGDDGLREDVAAALASRHVFARGGREALVHLLATVRGNEAVAVAGVILGAHVDDAPLRAEALDRLVHALADEDHRARIHALAVAPIGPAAASPEGPLLDAVRAAAQSDDLDVKLAALGRLAGLEGSAGAGARDHDGAIAALEAMAAPGGSEGLSPRASQARWLLARARDRRVQAWVESDLASTDPGTRLGAASALVALGRPTRAAALLADDDPRVRVEAACLLVHAAR